MISTITVNYKTADYVQTMLRSLYRHHQGRPIEVFLVENHSGDDLTEIKAEFPDVIVIESAQNLGFAGGCNLAMQQAKGDYVLLLNPDVIFQDDALYQIADMMQQHPDVGIGGISLKNLDGSQQKCVWRFPTPIDQLLLLLKVHHVFPKIGPIARWRFDDFDYKTTQDVDQVMGAFFCIRRAVIDQIGLLDDGFFMWYEEVDYCKRAIQASWKVTYFSQISVRHKKGSSFDRVETIWKQKILRASIRRFLLKHYGKFVWMCFVMLNPIFVCLGWISSKVKPV